MTGDRRGRLSHEPDACPARVAIGGVTVDPPLVLGPMAGSTNRTLRLLCRRGGAGLVCSEMVSVNAIMQGSERTHRMLETWPGERPVSIQLFGAEPEIMRDAVPVAVAAGADIIDINMGCCVPKVRRGGAGVALMADPRAAEALTAAAVEASAVPVTVKIRAGLTADDGGYVEFARRMQGAGAAAVTVHWRTAAQGFRGTPGWERIARVVEALEVPVIGSGDVRQPEDALRMIGESGCAAVMIARGAWGRPWLFGQAAAALRGEGAGAEGSLAERFGVALLHAQMLALDDGERLAVHQMRQQMHHYMKGLPNAALFRRQINSVDSLQELSDLTLAYAAEVRNVLSGEGSL